MLHLWAYSGAKTDSTANEAAPAIGDQSMNRTSATGTYLMGRDYTIAAAAIFNDTATRARINAPSLRDLIYPEIYPLNLLAQPTADWDIWKPGLNGPRVKRGEEVGVDTSNGASTVDTIHALLWGMDALTPIPSGRRFTARGTSTITQVASAWVSGPLALSDTLATGRYGVIGIAAAIAGVVAVRLIFPGQTDWRPGCVCGSAITVNDYRQSFRAGEFGLLGTFDQTAPPQVECLGGTAGSATVAVILDLVEL